jgi:hypothetical protein
VEIFQFALLLQSMARLKMLDNIDNIIFRRCSFVVAVWPERSAIAAKRADE